MRKKPGPRGWTGGSFGRTRERWLESRTDCRSRLVWSSGDREREDTTTGSIILSLSFVLIPFVKGGSYPELCAQRTDEGGGFLWLLHGGYKIGGPLGGPGARFFCLSLSYVSHWDES
jgi:hypothetical protein